jgi:DNA end-binding protein Ku
MRAIWSGSISFGLVNIPVKAYTAVRAHTVHFHELQKGTGARVRHKKVSERTGKEIDGKNIELGYEVSSGKYVTVDPDELAELRPRTTRVIDISDFVALDDIDPIYYERTYWLAPSDDTAGRPYLLLLAAMEKENRVGIGTVVMRRKQYLGAIRPLDGALALSTMRFADEVVDRSAIEQLPSRRTKPRPAEIKLAKSIIDALASKWDPERYHDTYAEDVRRIIKQRAAGKTVKAEEPAGGPGPVIDLMEALEASVASARNGRRTTKRKSTKRSASSNGRRKKVSA